MAWKFRLLTPNNSGKVGVLSVIWIRHTHLVISFKLRIVRGSAVAELCLLANEQTGLSPVHGTDGDGTYSPEGTSRWDRTTEQFEYGTWTIQRS